MNDNFKPANEQEERGWGIPRGFYSKTKYYGMGVSKTIYIIGVFAVTSQLYGSFFPSELFLEFLIFVLSTNILAIYLILPTSAGGTNFNVILTFLTRRSRKYYSIDRNVYPEYLGHQEKKKRRVF